MGEKWTAVRIRGCKGAERIVCLTAHDYSVARVLDEAGIHLVLVGDSLAMTALGYQTTLPVTMREMLHHTAAVARGVRSALVVADMPFMSYQESVEQAVRNAGRFIKSAGADAVKLEGGALRVPAIKAITANGIPVLGHIGLTPQSIREFGSYRVQGRETETAAKLVDDARALEDAGAFAVVLECMPVELGRRITAGVGIPTIGIGAGPHCDGQVLVTHDLLGLYAGKSPKFAKRYADLGSEMKRAVASYRDEVAGGVFPDADHSY
ncbi:MAG: 3-methyl-2-oxobutanoate hydroxymethyltransferase [Lentisphaerae bacterium]|nr:3-methyl-2-oxobutanoate hydroxymethyltransferase [Lentisphaerota bacterium]